MATKINESYYGAESSFVTNSPNSKRSPYNLAYLMRNNIYQGGSFDFTASPWGIGKSSVSSDFIFTPAKSDIWHFHHYENTKKNTPFWLYHNSATIEGSDIANNISGDSATYTNFGRVLYKNRLSPNTELAVNNTDILSTMSLDDNSVISMPGTYSISAITYADYQNLRLVIHDVWYKATNSNTISHCRFSDLVSGTVTNVDKIVGFYTDVRERATGNSTGVNPSVGGSELPIPEFYQTCYYDTEETWVRPWRSIHTIGTPFWSTYDLSAVWPMYNSAEAVLYESLYETPTASDVVYFRNNSNFYGHALSQVQEFDDVSYHWEIGIKSWASTPFPITGTISNGSTYQADTYQSYVYMELDGEYEDKTEAYIKAILHEAAFFGLPVTDSSHITENIGGSNTYLPVFDVHMITTGNYSGGSESLSLPNATWTDIFGLNMPEYDPTYDPDPQPDPDDGDSGNLNNKGLYTNRFTNPSYTVWALYGTSLSNNGLDAIIAAINDLYTTDPNGNRKWELNFKGTNPSDYIVGLYAYPLNFAVSENNYVFKLGPVEFETINVKKYADNGYFSFGSIDLSYASTDVTWYRDFRDYPPYTSAELYVPFCGTYDIDLAFFIGHSMEIIGYYDIYTGALSCAIYRDAKTLYKTVNGQIGVQLPLTAARAGDYQNNIHALEVALKQNNIRLATSALTLGASAATAIATGGASVAVGVGAIGGVSSLANTLTERENIEYKLSHTQPVPAQTGAAETQNSYRVGDIYPKLYVKRAKKISNYNPTIYAQTVGNACCINDILGYVGGDEETPRTGLVVCSNIDTINMQKTVNNTTVCPTVEEINAIKQALANGVYL